MLLFGCTACGEMFQVHVHFYNATPTQATCTEKGYTTYTCECGDTYTADETPALGHREAAIRGTLATCTQDGMSDGKYCLTCNETLAEQEIVKATGHNYINKECTKCGDKITDSVGLEYAQNSDGTYAVTGIGTCTDTEIIIPATYNGKAVTSIGNYAFLICISLTEIVIPDSVTSIGRDAFAYCSSLTSVVIPDSVTSIENYAFRDCESLTEIVIPDSVTSIGEGAFCLCDNLMSITFKDTSTWYRTSDYDDWQNQTGGTETDVTNASTNANYFKSSYADYYWYKK